MSRTSYLYLCTTGKIPHPVVPPLQTDRAFRKKKYIWNRIRNHLLQIRERDGVETFTLSVKKKALLCHIYVAQTIKLFWSLYLSTLHWLFRFSVHSPTHSLFADSPPIPDWAKFVDFTDSPFSRKWRSSSMNEFSMKKTAYNYQSLLFQNLEILKSLT